MSTIPYREPLKLNKSYNEEFSKGTIVVALYKSWQKGIEVIRCCLPYTNMDVLPMRYDTGYVNRAALYKRIWVLPEDLSQHTVLCKQCGNSSDFICEDNISECLKCGSILVGMKCIVNKEVPSTTPKTATEDEEEDYFDAVREEIMEEEDDTYYNEDDNGETW